MSDRPNIKKMPPEKQQAWDDDRARTGIVIMNGKLYDWDAEREGRRPMTMEEYEAKQAELEKALDEYRRQKGRRPSETDHLD
jgi:hypothetical protein